MCAERVPTLTELCVRHLSQATFGRALAQNVDLLFDLPDDIVSRLLANCGAKDLSFVEDKFREERGIIIYTNEIWRKHTRKRFGTAISLEGEDEWKRQHWRSKYYELSEKEEQKLKATALKFKKARQIDEQERTLLQAKKIKSEYAPLRRRKPKSDSITGKSKAFRHIIRRAGKYDPVEESFVRKHGRRTQASVVVPVKKSPLTKRLERLSAQT